MTGQSFRRWTAPVYDISRFMGPRLLAVTRADLEKGGGWLEVLRVPEAAAAP